MKTALRWALRLGFAGGAAVATYFGSVQDAHAWLNVGAEVGAGKRTDTNVGVAAGAHLEVNPVGGLYVGGYFFYLNADENAPPYATKDSIRFNTLGGRLRYVLPASKQWKPFVMAGLGQTWASYPSFLVPSGTTLNASTSSQQLGEVDSRKGRFLEIPLGLGIIYQPVKQAHVDLGFAYRIGTHFKGDAYEPPPNHVAYEEGKGGWSVTLGVALDL